jgi:hypothetical protein
MKWISHTHQITTTLCRSACPRHAGHAGLSLQLLSRRTTLTRGALALLRFSLQHTAGNRLTALALRVRVTNVHCSCTKVTNIIFEPPSVQRGVTVFPHA